MRADESTLRGVSLIELLVSAAALAIALSVLVPAIERHQADSRLTAEIGNLRVIIEAAFKYSHDDPDGVLGPVHPLASHFNGEGAVEYGGGPGAMNYVGWNGDFDPRTRPLNHIIYGLNTIQASTMPGDVSVFKEFQCRGDELGWQIWEGFDTGPYETEPNSHYLGNGTSFRMNNLAYDDGTSLGMYGRPAKRIPAPSLTVAFMEARAWQTVWTNDAWPILEPGTLTSYHRKLGYFLVNYCDGHAAFQNFGSDTYYQHVHGPPPYDQEEDVRGSWGRMDCLPEASVSY